MSFNLEIIFIRRFFEQSAAKMGFNCIFICSRLGFKNTHIKQIKFLFAAFTTAGVLVLFSTFTSAVGSIEPHSLARKILILLLSCLKNLHSKAESGKREKLNKLGLQPARFARGLKPKLVEYTRN